MNSTLHMALVIKKKIEKKKKRIRFNENETGSESMLSLESF